MTTAPANSTTINHAVVQPQHEPPQKAMGRRGVPGMKLGKLTQPAAPNDAQIKVDDAAKFKRGDVLQANEEFMKATGDGDPSNGMVPVERGVDKKGKPNGSKRKQHPANTDLILLVLVVSVNSEKMGVRTVIDGQTLSVIRGYDGTVPADQPAGSSIAYAEPDWMDDANANGDASLNPDGHGSPDSDGDGCSNVEEAGTNPSSGGERDALWPYDFADPPGPATGGVLTAASARSKSVVLADVSVVLAYVGRTTTHAAYIADNNLDGVPDGLQIDRTPADEAHRSNQPNGAITLQDASVTLAQVGTSCVPAP